MALFGGGFTGTPNVGFGLSDTARELRMGWRLRSAMKGDDGGLSLRLVTALSFQAEAVPGLARKMVFAYISCNS